MKVPAADHAFLEAAPDAVLLVGLDGRIVYANPPALALFDPDGSRMVGAHVDDLVPDHLRAGHAQHRADYVAAPEVRRMGSRSVMLLGRRFDDTVFPCEIALSPVSEDGVELTMAVVRDISSRLVSEQQTQMIRASLDVIDDTVVLCDEGDLTVRYVNRGAEAQFGRNADEVIDQMTLTDLISASERERFGDLLVPLRRGRVESVTVTVAIDTSDDDMAMVEMSIHRSPVHFDGGKRHLVAMVARDVTERQDAERRLQVSEARFRSAFDDAPVAMVITDVSVEGVPRIVEANHEFGILVDQVPTDLIGRPIAEITHPDDRNRAEQEAAWRGPGPSVVEKRYVRRDGASVWCREHSGDLVSDADRRRLTHVVDITRQVEAEAERDRREDTLITLGDIRRRLLDEQPVLDALMDIGAAAVRLTGGRAALVLVPRHGAFEVISISGDVDAVSLGLGEVGDVEVASQVLASGDSRCVTGLPDTDFPFVACDGAVIAVPLLTRDAAEGVMFVVGVEPSPSPMVTSAVSALAHEAALAIQLGRSRRERRRLMVIEDRDRIARDLHDVVIQRLFAAGMRLQSAASSGANLRGRVIEAVRELDETIGVIRDTIFRLTRSEPDLHDEIILLAEQFSTPEGRSVDVHLDPDLGSVAERVAEHVLPTVNELLSNALRHSDASTIRLDVHKVDDDIEVVLSDDGCGFDPDQAAGFGLGNLAARATQLGGWVRFDTAPGEGTTVTWRAPLGDQTHHR